MKLEHKVAVGLVGLVALVGGVFYFANQPKKPTSGIALDKPSSPVPSAKTAGDKTVTGAPTASNRPTAPAVPVAKPNTGNQPTTKLDSPLASNANTKNDAKLPPVAVPPPARREGVISTDPKTLAGEGSGSGSTGTPIGSSTPPTNPSVGNNVPTGGGSHTGNNPGSNTSSTPGLSGPPAPHGETEKPKPPITSPLDILKVKPTTDKPEGSALSAQPQPRRSLSDSEIERPDGAPPVADLGKKTPATTATPLPDHKTVENETKLVPSNGKDKSNKPTTPAVNMASKPDGGISKTVSGESYTIKSGDRLATIAKKRYGSESYVKQILDANPGLNPDRIVAGKSIMLPMKEGEVASTPSPTNTVTPGTTKKNTGPTSTTDPKTELAKTGTNKPEAAKTDDKNAKPVDVSTDTYVVRKGDTLRKIAKAKLGNENAWTEIFRLNKDKLKTQDGLSIGMSLRMPAVKKTESARAIP